MADDLTPAQIRAYRILDNKIAESPWSYEALELELPQIDLSGYDLRWHANLELPQTLEKARCLRAHRAGAALGISSPWDSIALCAKTLQGQRMSNGLWARKEQTCCSRTRPIMQTTREWPVKLLNDSMPSDRFAAFLESAFSNAKSVMRPGAAFFYLVLVHGCL